MDTAKTLPKKDYFLYNCEIFNAEDQNILTKVHCEFVKIKTATHSYKINSRYIPNTPSSKFLPILFMHGHGSTCTWATWIKLALLLYKVGYPIVLIDLPGYGASTVDDRDRVNPKLWLEDGPDIILKLLDHYGFKKVLGVGFCGGAAALIRAISKYPERFGSRHVFHNSIISAIPPEFEKNLKMNGIKVWVSWCEDPDHLKASVAYKWFNSKRKENHPNITLQDIIDDDLPLLATWSKNMGRKTDYVCIFDISKGYIDFVEEFLEGKKPSFKSNPLTNTTTSFKKLGLKDANLDDMDEDLKLAIALSLSENQPQ